MLAGHGFRFGRFMPLVCWLCASVCVSCSTGGEPSPDLSPPESPADTDGVDPAALDQSDHQPHEQDDPDDSSEDDQTPTPPDEPDDLPLIIIEDDPQSGGDVENRPPLADAGRDLFVEEGTRVELDGSGSVDPGGDELSHAWRQVAGPSISLERDDQALLVFMAPEIDADSLLTFRLTVSDGELETSDDVNVLVANLLSGASVEVTADAGPDQEVPAGDFVELDGSGSFGTGEGPLEFLWTQREGPPVTLSTDDAPIVTFTAPGDLQAATVIVFEIRVMQEDGVGADQVDVLVNASLEGPDPPGGDGGGGDDPPPECSADEDCADGLFCNGDESCTNGQCAGGVAPCTEGICDESVDDCVECLTDSDCGNGVFCDGEEVCTDGQCAAGDDPCPGQFCEESEDACTDCLLDSDCDDGQFCNGAERCTDGACVAGGDPCPGQLCEELTQECVDCLLDADCDDRLFCNGAERCTEGACQAGDDPCDGENCDEDEGACSGLNCDGEDPPFGSGVQAGTLLGDDVDEASGLVASRQNPDVLWTHNDDGGDNRLFAIHTDGTLLGTYTVGSGAYDPEDIAIGPGPQSGVDYLYWGDIGDNNNVRSSIFVKRVPEPPVDANQDPVDVVLGNVDVIRLAYPTGGDAPSHKDAETLLVDPLNGDLYLVTKRTSLGRVYRAAYPQSTSETTTMTFVAEIDWGGSTGGDVSPDGTLIVIRRYTGSNPEASVWQRPVDGNLWDAFAGDRCDVDLRWERQGEAICWDPDGRGLYTVSEDESQNAEIPIWYYPRNGG